MYKNKSEQIIEVFQSFKMAPGPDDAFAEKGYAAMVRKMAPHIACNLPVKFSMLGYPFKSMNTRDIALGPLPDLGEQLSLQQFGRFVSAIKDVYPAGAEISIISDGHAFNDVYGTPDREVHEYAERCKDMSKHLPINWYDMFSFYPKSMTAQSIREAIMSEYGIAAEELEKRILYDVNVNHVYRSIMRFMREGLEIKPFSSSTQRQKQAKIMARELMFRNEAYSKLIQTNFSDHVRLSMHQSNNDGTKYSFQLIPSPDARLSPWMSAVLLRKYAGPTTIHRKDAEEAGHELVYQNGQPFYFQEL